MIENSLKKNLRVIPINRRKDLKNMYLGNTIMKRLMDTVDQQLIGKK